MGFNSAFKGLNEKEV